MPAVSTLGGSLEVWGQPEIHKQKTNKKPKKHEKEKEEENVLRIISIGKRKSKSQWESTTNLLNGCTNNNKNWQDMMKLELSYCEWEYEMIQPYSVVSEDIKVTVWSRFSSATNNTQVKWKYASV